MLSGWLKKQGESMSYSAFVKKAYPESKAAFDQHLTLISRIYRPSGLVIGYIAWRAGLSGNAISAFRIIMFLIGFPLLIPSGSDFFGWRLLGFFLIWFSKVLDFSDGAVARASGSCSRLGHTLDELGDQPISQGMSLSLIAYFSGYPFLVPISIFLEFVIHRFGAPLKDLNPARKPDNADRKSASYKNFIARHLLDGYEAGHKTSSALFLLANFVCKLFKSDFMHLAGIPLFIALFNIPDKYLWFPLACTTLIGLYTLVATIRFIGGVRALSAS
jgi:hypothetical protein